jgi:hypothetical protein
MERRKEEKVDDFTGLRWNKNRTSGEAGSRAND